MALTQIEVPSIGIFKYSTTEQATPLKWVDNSTIYAKTITVSSVITDGTKIDSTLTESNCELIGMTGSMRNNADDNIMVINFGKYATQFYSVYLGDDGVYFTLGSQFSSNAKDLIVTLWYTKK